MKKWLLLGGALLMMLGADAQKRKKEKEDIPEPTWDMDTVLKQPVPLIRAGFHDKLDKEQRRADQADGNVDERISYGDSEPFSNLLTRYLLHEPDQLQKAIENLPVEHRIKVLYLNQLTENVKKFSTDNYSHKVDPLYFKDLMENYKGLIGAIQRQAVDSFVHANLTLAMMQNLPMAEESRAAKVELYTYLSKRYPDIMIGELDKMYNDQLADTIIKYVAPVYPNLIMNYATSTSYKKDLVRRSGDPFVKAIVRIARESSSPLKALVFLGDVYKGKKTVADVDRITASEREYYKNLVELRVNKEPIAIETYNLELVRIAKNYTRNINDLHDAKDDVRFRSINDFNARELYYLGIFTQDEIYTSSFLGVFKRMMAKLGTETSDAFLAGVDNDKFRTFIRMCANYNTLDTFLGKMDESHKTRLIADFVAGLEKGQGDNLEDAVDVADSYGSINDPKLLEFLRTKVIDNYERSKKENSKKGIAIYGLLANLFNSKNREGGENESWSDQASASFHLPSISKVPFKYLETDGDTVIQRVFVYGDEDGKTAYASYMSGFKGNPNWRLQETKYWVKLTALKGHPMMIFINLPLTEPQDDDAQKALSAYLEDNSIRPAIIVHRGHSYHVPTTFDALTKDTRVLVLGSCGGYHNLKTVLDKAPDAHIISSKQTGSRSVNEPILRKMNEYLLEGKDLDWVAMWKDLGTQFDKDPASKVLFDDYVPPHKNLGAIFLKAYKQLMSLDGV